MENKQQIIPIQYVPVTPCEEDEIDLKELIKTVLKYKKFIVIFTLIITLTAAIYSFLKTPIYETQANIQVGYLYNSNSKNNPKIYILDPQAVKIFIKTNFNNSDNKNLPQIEINFLKGTNDVLNLKIYTHSNKEGFNYLNKILLAVNNKENKKLNIYIKNIQSQILILKNYINDLKKQNQSLKKQLTKTHNPDIYKAILNKISQNKKEIVSAKLKIANLQNQISPVNITKTQIIGKIIQHDHPIKPKKKLTITVAFITGLILSIFLVFFIEFIKSFKEENPTT
jgi:uncharacterized protein involved in exopolysaccharide biosynthesis